jgi:hypothetical protein
MGGCPLRVVRISETAMPRRGPPPLKETAVWMEGASSGAGYINRGFSKKAHRNPGFLLELWDAPQRHHFLAGRFKYGGDWQATDSVPTGPVTLPFLP